LKLLLKISENPLLLLIVVIGVWYSTGDFLKLTATFMTIITLQVIIEKLAKGSVGRVLFISWCLVIPLGSLTLFLRDPIFLQWKFSIFHWFLGLALLGSQIIKGPFLIKKMLISVMPQLDEVPISAWNNVTYFISLALLIIGTINLYFIYFADITTWVNFKFYGVTVLNIVTLGSAFYYLSTKTSFTQKD
jgi:intracellular septation protein